MHGSQARHHRSLGGRQWLAAHRGGGTRAFGWGLFAIVLLLALLIMMRGAIGQEIVTYRKAGSSFDDVKLDITDAITNRGLVVDFNGNVGGMLARTGKDVGSTREVYKNAEYFSFCSAKLSRDMMEADAANAAFCPYLMFVYEVASTPGEIVIGYRKLPVTGNDASVKAFAAINTLLDGIAKKAAK